MVEDIYSNALNSSTQLQDDTSDYYVVSEYVN